MRDTRQEDFFYLIAGDDLHQAFQMVQVGMGQNNQIDGFHPERSHFSQSFGDRSAWTSIYKHDSIMRGLNENAVALSDVQKRNLELLGKTPEVTGIETKKEARRQREVRKKSLEGHISSPTVSSILPYRR